MDDQIMDRCGVRARAHFPSGESLGCCLYFAAAGLTISGRWQVCSKPVGPLQEFVEQLPWHGDLRHLERDVPGNVRDGHNRCQEATSAAMGHRQ